jgi:hypothetical protein
MNRFSLINSHEAGSFTNTNRHINFTIPATGVYDLSQCFIQLVCRLITNSTEVHNMVLKNSGSVKITPKNIDLIRNCWLSGSKVGPLENINRVNVLQTNLLEITKSTTEKMSMVDTIYQVRDFQEGMLLSPFVEMHKDGSIPSSYRDAYLRIPLSQLYSLGSLKALDLTKTGDLMVHIELEDLSYMSFVEAKLFKSPALAGEGVMELVATNTNQITTAEYDPVDNPDGIKYESLEQSPYFVGQSLVLTTVPALPTGATPVIVTGIVHNVVQKTLTLTLDYTFNVTDPVVVFTSVRVAEKENAVPVSFSISNANLGVCELMGAKTGSGDMLEYTTFTSEQYSNNANSLEKIFEVEANCVNAMLFFNNNTSNLISRNDKVNDYRMRVGDATGQKDVYDRQIKVNYLNGGVICHDPLHYDAINRTFANATIPIKNMSFLNMLRDNDAKSVSNDARYADPEQAILMLCTPMPLSQSSKTLQFSVTTQGALDTIQNVILYKQVVRNVKLM